MSPEAKKELIEEGRQRHDIAYKYSIILAVDEQVAGDMLRSFTQRLNHMLSNCAGCIRNWHMGRKAYLKELQEYATQNDYTIRWIWTDLRPDDTMKMMSDRSARTYSTSTFSELTEACNPHKQYLLE